MHAYDYAILIAGTILWAIPFPLVRSRQKGALSLDRRARWGVALEFIGYTLLWQGSFWTRTLSSWQVSLAIVLFLAASLLSWTASRVLGRHLRVDAALESNHQLICAGPYRWMRHPIYTSMLCVLLATGILIAPLYLFVPHCWRSSLARTSGYAWRMGCWHHVLATSFWLTGAGLGR